MTLISCLIGIDDPLIIDASVVVNLNATGYADRILAALPTKVFIPVPVINELQRGALLGHSDATDLQGLLENGIVDGLNVPELAQSEYIALVSGSSTSSLGDGEAATIASAIVSGAWAAIDERKARRICRERHQNLKVACTLDILSHPAVIDALTSEEFSAALLAALEVAHMQVQIEHMNWVVRQIEPSRIQGCISLPHSVRRRALRAI